MTTPAYKDAPEQQPQDDDTQPSPGCDPDLLDTLKCAAKGIEAQAKYNAEHLEALTTARDGYDNARKLYGDAWSTAEPLVAKAKKQLAALLDQLICLLDDPDVVRKLDRAFAVVESRLDDCGDQGGCYCRADCDFSDELSDCPPEELPARIADITQRTKDAEECFKDLIEESTKLTGRANDAQKEIDGISTRIGGNPAPTDLPRLYAEALVAGRHLSAVWRGFTDVNDYMDCICVVLTCMLKGHSAAAELTRRHEVHECQRKAEKEACILLQTNTADEVMSEYLKVSATYGDPAQESDEYGDRDQESDGYGDRDDDGKPEGYGHRDRDDRDPRQDDRYRGQNDRGHGKTDDRYRDRDDDHDRYPRGKTGYAGRKDDRGGPRDTGLSSR